MIASIDGAATGSDGLSGPLGGEADRKLFLGLRAISDVVLVGAGTVRSEGYGPVRSGQPLAIVSRTLDLDFSAPLFTEAITKTIIVTVEDAPRLEEARKAADVIVAGASTVDFAVALEELHRRGLTKVLCEGGPVILAQIAAADLLDELCLTVAPYLVGGSSQRILQGPPSSTTLLLADVRKDGDFLFLRYAKPV